MAFLNRKMQREMLEYLRVEYPDVRDDLMPCFVTSSSEPSAREVVIRNLAYLIDYELVEAKRLFSQQHAVSFGAIRITGKGIDFLEEDGGLRSILGVITVRIHEDSIKQLLENRIALSALPDAKKQGLVRRLRALKEDGMKKLTDKLLATGVDALVTHAGDLFESLEDVL